MRCRCVRFVSALGPAEPQPVHGSTVITLTTTTPTISPSSAEARVLANHPSTPPTAGMPHRVLSSWTRSRGTQPSYSDPPKIWPPTTTWPPCRSRRARREPSASPPPAPGRRAVIAGRAAGPGSAPCRPSDDQRDHTVDGCGDHHGDYGENHPRDTTGSSMTSSARSP